MPLISTRGAPSRSPEYDIATTRLSWAVVRYAYTVPSSSGARVRPSSPDSPSGRTSGTRPSGPVAVTRCTTPAGSTRTTRAWSRSESRYEPSGSRARPQGTSRWDASTSTFATPVATPVAGPVAGPVLGLAEALRVLEALGDGLAEPAGGLVGAAALPPPEHAASSRTAATANGRMVHPDLLGPPRLA